MTPRRRDLPSAHANNNSQGSPAPRGRGGHGASVGTRPPRRWAGGPKANKSLELIRALAGPEEPFRRARGQIAAGRTRAAFLTPPRCLLSKQAPPVPFWELHSLAQSPALCHGAEPCRGEGRWGAVGEQLPVGTPGVAAFLGCSHPAPPLGLLPLGQVQLSPSCLCTLT